MGKKYIIIDRDTCIGCGSCVAMSNNKCDFKDGKVWCVEEKIENSEDIVNICPVDAITSSDSLEDYLLVKEKFKIK